MTTPASISPSNTVSNSSSAVTQVSTTSSGSFINPAFISATAKVTADLQLLLTPLPSRLPGAIDTKLTQTQASQLNNQSILLLMEKQSAQVFLPNALSSHSLSLTPALTNLMRAWFNQGARTSLSSLPKELLAFLKSELGGEFPNDLNKLVKLHQNKQLLTLQLLIKSPIAEISLSASQKAVDTETLQQLLQFIVPIPLNDKAKVIIREHNSSKDENNKGPQALSFEMEFDFSPIGTMTIAVSLDKFALTTQCYCSSKLMMDKTRKYWPKLQQRLERLGFSCHNTLHLEPVEVSKKLPRHPGLINLKV